jgi:O-antigen/teichoic acid export membrane protein
MPEDEDKQILNIILKGAGLAAIGMMFSKFITYLYRALVGRMLGPEAYGQLNTGMMVLGIITVLSGASVTGNAVGKFVPQYRANEEKAKIKGLIIAMLEFSLTTSFILGIITFLSAEFLAKQIFDNTQLIPVIQVMGMLGVLSRPYNIFIETTVGFNTTKYRVITTHFFQNIVQLAVTATLLFAGFNIMGAVWGWAAGLLSSLILAFYFMEKKFGPILLSDIKPDYNRKEVYKYSYPLMASSFIGVAMGWMDTAFLGYFLDQSSVGLYNAAYPIALLLTLPDSALGMLSLENLSEMDAEDKDKSTVIKTMNHWIFALTLPAFLLMVLFPEKILEILFGNQFTGAALALIILAFGNLTEGATGKINDILKSKGITKVLLYNTALNLFLNLALNLYLIPRYGITGAAIATASSTIFVNIILISEGWLMAKINPFTKTMAKTLTSGLISLTVIYTGTELFFKYTPLWALTISGTLFLALYTLIFLKIGGLKEYDKEIILTMSRKIGEEEKVEKLLSLLT